MDSAMRRILSFPCEGARLAATLDEAAGSSGLLILSGGNEIRIGAHRGMARLAADIAAAGYPVLRFDRRGIGDSEGENGGFESSHPDIAAAIAAFRAECPSLARIVAFGNCDAASALMLHQPDVTASILANPWVIETSEGTPPPAAIKAHYAQRLRDPKAWLSLFTGSVNLRKLAGGLLRIATPQAPSSLAARVAGGMTSFGGAITLILAKRDGTAIAFADAWERPTFAEVRARADIKRVDIDSASHSFAEDADYRVLLGTIIDGLEDLG
jgi:exosortase A-associated hydrolase 1